MKKSRWFLWISLVAVAITGIALYALAPANEDDFPHPLNGLFRELHGTSMFFTLIMLGYMFADHVQKKLAKRKHHWDGYLHLCVWLLLSVSGLLLYYPQETLEDLGLNTAQVHWWLGVTLIALFPIHASRKFILRHYYRWRYARKTKQTTR